MGTVVPDIELGKDSEIANEEIEAENTKIDRSFHAKKSRIDPAKADKFRADFQRLKRYLNLDENLNPKQFLKSNHYKGNSDQLIFPLRFPRKNCSEEKFSFHQSSDQT